MKLIKQEFSQRMHDCGPGDIEPRLSIEIQDAGAGGYIVMHAEHWSMEAADIDQLVLVLRKTLKNCEP